jgi:hypothetical protein
LSFYEGVGVLKIEKSESELEVLKIKESEAELFCTDSTALLSVDIQQQQQQRISSLLRSV